MVLDSNHNCAILNGPTLTDIGDTDIIINIGFFNGGGVPHFEIHGKNNDFETCLEICFARYHTPVSGKKPSLLTDIQIDELVTFLNKRVSLDVNNLFLIYRNWEYFNIGENFGVSADIQPCHPGAYYRLKII